MKSAVLFAMAVLSALAAIVVWARSDAIADYLGGLRNDMLRNNAKRASAPVFTVRVGAVAVFFGSILFAVGGVASIGE